MAEPVSSAGGWPSRDTAALDGYAVCAAETEGADAYAPSPVPNIPVAAGQDMPPGTDAVLPFEAVSSDGPDIEVLAPVARGHGLARAGSELAPGQMALPLGRVLRPEDLALLVLLGLSSVQVVRCPRVCLVVPGPKGGGADALTPMLLALAARDGGVCKPVPCPASDQAGLAQALALAAQGKTACPLNG